MMADRYLIDDHKTADLLPERIARSNKGTYGHSLITSPWGDVVGQLDEREGLLICEIDLDQVRRVREELPFLKQRRTDVYSLCSSGTKLK